MDTDPPLTTGECSDVLTSRVFCVSDTLIVCVFVIDYVWIGGSVEVEHCALAANTPTAEDCTLYPSDHMAVVATVSFHS